jgi:hypothetical protein
MSIIVTAKFNSQDFEVEVFHDGHLEFLDYDIEYDKACLEFKYPETSALKLLKTWDDNAPLVISELMQIHINYIALLALDWAEHVADAYVVYGHDKRGGADKLVSILNSTRHQISILENEVTKENILNLEALARGAYSKIGEHPSEEAKYAARATYHAIMVLIKSKRYANPRAEASSVAACAKSTNLEYLYLVLMEDEQAAKKEELWQIRRFVDCMEAVGQGFDWPDMKVTP